MSTLETDRFQLARKRVWLKQQNRLYTRELVPVPPEKWPTAFNPVREKYTITHVWRSSDFLVQVINEGGHIRLSINRAQIDDSGQWKDNITWDELQHIKNACGFPSHAAVEVFPPASKVVNVANMRHLWILPEPPPFMW